MNRSNNNKKKINNYDSIDIFPLKPDELRYLRTLGPLVDAWGYRAGKSGNHTKFEKRTHTQGGKGSWFAVQEITDIVFRNLQQVVYRGQTFVYKDDIIKKLRSIMSFRSYGNNEKCACLPPTLPAFLAEFMDSSEKTTDLMEGLAYRYITRDESSIGYFAIVSAARALVRMVKTGKILPGLEIVEEAARKLGIR